MKIFSYTLQHVTTEQIIKSFGYKSYSFFLDSNDHSHPQNKYSIFGFDPSEIINKHYKNFKSLESILNQNKPINIDEFSQYPFVGGLIGYIPYEFGYDCQGMENYFPTSNNEALFGLFNKMILISHHEKTITLFVTENNKESADRIYTEIYDILTKNSDNMSNSVIAFKETDLLKNFKKNVTDIISYIKNGDIFQANISHDFIADTPNNFDAVLHFLRLRQNNPAPYSAFLNCGDIQYLSSSPENFISFDGEYITTKPIKGTISDAYDISVLENNEKDRAENIMIVDLMRNDLSKICEEDSVEVTNLCAIETFKNLHHMVSTIHGKLKNNLTIFDAMLALFPAGSITGAPKIRAMEIIAELEQRPRGLYCGSIGYIDYNHKSQFNIAIRTIEITTDTIKFSVGGGITSLSNPDDEYQETITKAQKILDSFGELK
jgi:para-aminobenzoate synthetase component 1